MSKQVTQHQKCTQNTLKKIYTGELTQLQMSVNELSKFSSGLVIYYPEKKEYINFLYTVISLKIQFKQSTIINSSQKKKPESIKKPTSNEKGLKQYLSDLFGFFPKKKAPQIKETTQLQLKGSEDPQSRSYSTQVGSANGFELEESFEKLKEN